MNDHCWYCDNPILPPVEIVGRIVAGQRKLIHRSCMRRLVRLALELDFEGDAA